MDKFNSKIYRMKSTINKIKSEINTITKKNEESINNINSHTNCLSMQNLFTTSIPSEDPTDYPHPQLHPQHPNPIIIPTTDKGRNNQQYKRTMSARENPIKPPHLSSLSLRQSSNPIKLQYNPSSFYTYDDRDNDNTTPPTQYISITSKYKYHHNRANSFKTDGNTTATATTINPIKSNRNPYLNTMANGNDNIPCIKDDCKGGVTQLYINNNQPLRHQPKKKNMFLNLTHDVTSRKQQRIHCNTNEGRATRPVNIVDRDRIASMRMIEEINQLFEGKITMKELPARVYHSYAEAKKIDIMMQGLSEKYKERHSVNKANFDDVGKWVKNAAVRQELYAQEKELYRSLCEELIGQINKNEINDLISYTNNLISDDHYNTKNLKTVSKDFVKSINAMIRNHYLSLENNC